MKNSEKTNPGLPGEFIDLWLKEDIGSGDHTTLSSIPEEAQGSANLLVKEAGILAGVEIAEKIFKRFDRDLMLDKKLSDGSEILGGETAFTVSGKIRSILQTERLVLNVMQRMSGIATVTSKYVKEVEGTNTRILDTRKTTPGFRYIEKEAVRIGGGLNHRIGLHDMVLIKDNHIDFAGGIVKALNSAVNYLKNNNLYLKIEIEVRNLENIREVLQTNLADRILLDNFSIELTRKAVHLIDHKVETESSGGITFQTLRKYAECGVDYISIGALTHQLKSLDLSLKANF